MQAANDNNKRDPEFDRKLLAYEPALRARARKIAKHHDAAEELFQQTMVLMLRRHSNCRLETFWTWACLTMKNAAQEHIKGLSTMKRTADVCSLSSFEEMPGSTLATQESSAELAHVLSLLTGRGGRMVIRVASGETLEAVGKDYGIGKERVRQIVEKERARVMGLLGEAA
jgi:RNA polymerase sigma factor (sigma-70 family)